MLISLRLSVILLLYQKILSFNSGKNWNISKTKNHLLYQTIIIQINRQKILVIMEFGDNHK